VSTTRFAERQLQLAVCGMELPGEDLSDPDVCLRKRA
jgi:hypothetical protein